MFTNMTNKTFDFNGTFLPVSMKKLTRWDSSDSASMEEHLKKGIYTLCKPKVWGAKGPFVSNYVIADSTGRVFFTIDEFEIALAPEPESVPITDYTMQQPVVTTWQPKAFVTPNYTLPPVVPTAVTATSPRPSTPSPSTLALKPTALCLEFSILTPPTRSLAPWMLSCQAFSLPTGSLSTTSLLGLMGRPLMPRSTRSITATVARPSSIPAPSPTKVSPSVVPRTYGVYLFG